MMPTGGSPDDLGTVGAPCRGTRSPLAEVLSDMSSEFADTDNASYRHQLHERRERLQEVESKLNTTTRA